MVETQFRPVYHCQSQQVECRRVLMPPVPRPFSRISIQQQQDTCKHILTKTRTHKRKISNTNKQRDKPSFISEKQLLGYRYRGRWFLRPFLEMKEEKYVI